MLEWEKYMGKNSFKITRLMFHVIYETRERVFGSIFEIAI